MKKLGIKNIWYLQITTRFYLIASCVGVYKIKFFQVSFALHYYEMKSDRMGKLWNQGAIFLKNYFLIRLNYWGLYFKISWVFRKSKCVFTSGYLCNDQLLSSAHIPSHTILCAENLQLMIAHIRIGVSHRSQLQKMEREEKCLPSLRHLSILIVHEAFVPFSQNFSTFYKD